MDNEIVKRYTALKAAKDDIGLKRAAAVARRDDASAKMAFVISEIKAMGYSTVAELKAAIEMSEAELRVLLEDAEAKLRAGGYA